MGLTGRSRVRSELEHDPNYRLETRTRRGEIAITKELAQTFDTPFLGGILRGA